MSYWKSAWKVYKVNMFILGVLASIGSIWITAEKAKDEFSR